MFDRIAGLQIGRGYRLLNRGYWLSEERILWIHDAMRVDTNQPVSILLVSPNASQEDVDHLLQFLRQDGRFSLDINGAANIEGQSVSYAAFAPVSKNVLDQLSEVWHARDWVPPRPRPQPHTVKELTISETRRKVPWLPIVIGPAVVMCMVCVLAISIPVVDKLLATPTPTFTPTPTLTPTVTPTCTPTPAPTKLPEPTKAPAVPPTKAPAAAPPTKAPATATPTTTVSQK